VEISAMVVLADVLSDTGVDQEAETLYRDALDRIGMLPQGGEAQRARALDRLAVLMMYQERLDEAQSCMSEALDIRERILGADHPLTIESLNNLAAITYSQRRLVDAEHLARQAVSRARRVWGDEHPETASQLNNLGLFLLEQGEVEEAEKILSESVAADRRHRQSTDDQWVFSLNNLALSIASQGRYREAEPLYEEGLGIARLHDHRMEGPIAANLADLYCRTNRAEQGFAMAAAAREALVDDYAADDWRIAYLDSVEGGCQAALGNRELARSLLDSGFARLEAERGPDWLFTRLAERRIAEFESGAERRAP
jgi:tetratricopeptide (TPR) repeat protein